LGIHPDNSNSQYKGIGDIQFQQPVSGFPGFGTIYILMGNLSKTSRLSALAHRGLKNPVN
jgi:hypothetical protein